MKKPDFLFKSQVLKTDLCKKVRHFDRINTQNLLEGVVYDPQLEDLYIDMLFNHGKKAIEEARRINHASDTRATRLRKRVKKLIEKGDCLFLTLTFTDDAIASTSEITRRKYVARYLSSYESGGFVANIDYGVDDRFTKREHYHALIQCSQVKQDNWPYGNVDWEKVRLNGRNAEKSARKIPRYINKLTNHAIKDSAKRSYLIYSRDKNHEN